jgi:cytidylate kinase
MDEMVASIVDRDTRDSSREKGALRAASDAIVVDTTALTKNAVVEKLEREARSRIAGVGVQ